MNTDRELLELAAKAAGIPIVSCTCRNPKWPFAHDEPKSKKYGHWNPLVDDGDALRLAVTLHINLEFGPSHVYAINTKVQAFYADEESDGLLENATRNVIVRAAAEIGKAKL